MSPLARSHAAGPQSTRKTRMFVEATIPLLIAAIGLPLIGAAIKAENDEIV